MSKVLYSYRITSSSIYVYLTNIFIANIRENIYRCTIMENVFSILRCRWLQMNISPAKSITQCQGAKDGATVRPFKLIDIQIRAAEYEWMNLSPPSAAYLRQGTGSTLVQEMACRLVGAKPFPEPMLTYCQYDPLEINSVKFESNTQLSFMKISGKMSPAKWRSFYAGGDESTNTPGVSGYNNPGEWYHVGNNPGRK